MIFVSHRQGEHLDVFKHHLDFEPGGDAALFTITSYSVPASRGLGH